MRSATIHRTTAETDIQLGLKLDGTGKTTINTGCGFLIRYLPTLSTLTPVHSSLCNGRIKACLHPHSNRVTDDFQQHFKNVWHALLDRCHKYEKQHGRY